MYVLMVGSWELSRGVGSMVDEAQTKCDTIGSGLTVDPEGDPGQEHDHGTGHVEVDEEVARPSPHQEPSLQCRVETCCRYRACVAIECLNNANTVVDSASTMTAESSLLA